jgi:hypothetical protein
MTVKHALFELVLKPASTVGFGLLGGVMGAYILYLWRQKHAKDQLRKIARALEEVCKPTRPETTVRDVKKTLNLLGHITELFPAKTNAIGKPTAELLHLMDQIKDVLIRFKEERDNGSGSQMLAQALTRAKAPMDDIPHNTATELKELLRDIEIFLATGPILAFL